MTMAKSNSAARKATRIQGSLTLVDSASAVNDNAVRMTAQDRLVASLDEGWLVEHRRAFRHDSARLTVRYVTEMLTEQRMLAFTGRRVEVWRAEMSEEVELVEHFTLRIR
jgi:hypothetical protein